MSTTFQPQPTEDSFAVLHWYIECSWGGHADPRRFTSSAEAREGLVTHAQHCGDPECLDGLADGVFMLGVRPQHPESAAPQMRVSESTRHRMLVALGLVDTEERDDITTYITESCGAVDPADMMGRILIHRAIGAGDPGRPYTADRGVDPATGRPTAMMHVIGTPVGHLDGLMDELQQICEYAAAHGRQVQWC